MKKNYKTNTCQDCERIYPDWLTTRSVWMQVIGEYNGMFCPTCFHIRAFRQQKKNKMFFMIPVQKREEWKLYNKKLKI